MHTEAHKTARNPKGQKSAISQKRLKTFIQWENTAKMAPHSITTSHLLTNPKYKITLNDKTHINYKQF